MTWRRAAAGDATAALAVACPTCGVPAGEACLQPRHSTTRAAHAARLDAAVAAARAGAAAPPLARLAARQQRLAAAPAVRAPRRVPVVDLRRDGARYVAAPAQRRAPPGPHPVCVHTTLGYDAHLAGNAAKLARSWRDVRDMLAELFRGWRSGRSRSRPNYVEITNFSVAIYTSREDVP